MTDRRLRRRALPRLAASTVLVVALGACSGSNDGEAATPTTQPVTTTSTSVLTPDEAFDQALNDQLDGLDATFIGGSRAAGRTLCTNLTALDDQTDETTAGDLTATMLISAVFDGFSQPAIAAVVLRAAGEHYCPEHADAIEQVLASKGQ